MDTKYLVLAGLATYRLSELLVNEGGPNEIFFKFKESLTEDSFLRQLLHCVYCLGLWIALLFTIFYFINKKGAYYLVYSLAIAGIQYRMEQ